MRILMITDFYPPYWGGVEVLVHSMSRALVQRGHAVTVVTLSGPGLPEVAMEDGVAIHRVRSSIQRAGSLFTDQTRPWAPPTPDPGVMLSLRRLLAGESFDVVHGHDWLARSYLPFATQRREALTMSLHYFTLSCPKKNLTFHDAPCSGPGLRKCLGCASDHYGALKGPIVVGGQRWFGRRESERVDLFLPVSESTARENGLAAAGLPYQVLPNLLSAADTEGIDQTQLAKLPDEPFLLFVGDMRSEKGIDVLLAAYRRLESPPPLVIVAKVWEERSLPDGVTVHRGWANPTVRAAMSSCRALVAPSVWAEPFGIVVTEALAAGRPVVASRVGGIPEIVRDEREGLLVEPGDVTALADALRRIYADADLCETMAERARERALAYSADEVLPMVESAYARAMRLKDERSTA